MFFKLIKLILFCLSFDSMAETVKLNAIVHCPSMQECFLSVNPKTISNQKFWFTPENYNRANSLNGLWVKGEFKLTNTEIKKIIRMEVYAPNAVKINNSSVPRKN